MTSHLRTTKKTVLNLYGKYLYDSQAKKQNLSLVEVQQLQGYNTIKHKKTVTKKQSIPFDPSSKRLKNKIAQGRNSSLPTLYPIITRIITKTSFTRTENNPITYCNSSSTQKVVLSNFVKARRMETHQAGPAYHDRDQIPGEIFCFSKKIQRLLTHQSYYMLQYIHSNLYHIQIPCIITKKWQKILGDSVMLYTEKLTTGWKKLHSGTHDFCF